MVDIRFERVLALPATPTPNTLYFVRPTDATSAALLVTGNNSQAVPVGGATTDSMLKSQNLSGLGSYVTARANLGVTATGQDPTYLKSSSNLGDLTNVASARAALGLGSLATASSVNDSSWSGADLSIANGGTGSSTPGAARTALGLGSLATQDGTFSGVSSGTNTGDQNSVPGNAGTATKLATARTLASTGDISWSVTFDGSANVTAAGALATVNANAGSYGSATQVPAITVDGKGRVTAVTATAIATATETNAGLIEIATQAEVEAGTDDVRAPTPLKLANWTGRKLKAAANVGDGTATAFNVDHGFNTRDVVVTVMKTSGSYDDVIADVTRPTVNRVTVTFATAPAAGAYRVVVVG